MVARRRVGVFVRLALDLRFVLERCALAKTVATPVKGENSILATLQRDVGVFEGLSQEFPALRGVRDKVKSWIDFLEKTYPRKPDLFWNPMLNPGLPQPKIDLDHKDAAQLAKDCRAWIATLLSELDKPGTAIITDENLDTVFPNELLVQLDDATLDDWGDGVKAIFNLLPTPAAMILLRVAENVVRGLYRDTLGRDPSGMTWGQMLKELERDGKLRKPLLGYLDFLRDKRNEAEHPDKRFTQEEAERILLEIKGLLQEVQRAYS